MSKTKDSGANPPDQTPKQIAGRPFDPKWEAKEKSFKNFGYDLVKEYVFERNDAWNEEKVEEVERLLETQIEFGEYFNNWIRNKRWRRTFGDSFVFSKITKWTKKWLPRAERENNAARRNQAHGDRVRKKVFGLTAEGFTAKEIANILQEECTQNATKTQSKRNQNASGLQVGLRRVQQIRRSYKRNSPLNENNENKNEISSVSSKSVSSNAVICKSGKPVTNSQPSITTTKNFSNSSKDKSNSNGKTPHTTPNGTKGATAPEPRMEDLKAKEPEQQKEEKVAFDYGPENENSIRLPSRLEGIKFGTPEYRELSDEDQCLVRLSTVIEIRAKDLDDCGSDEVVRQTMEARKAYLKYVYVLDSGERLSD